MPRERGQVEQVVLGQAVAPQRLARLTGEHMLAHERVRRRHVHAPVVGRAALVVDDQHVDP
ncbi:hypothetical protein [Nannocystis pusilla]|uniref:hypothetical protein n=1 Tax=Nannocystis pusilla TaxID=889268 RepID=UPI003B7769E0